MNRLEFHCRLLVLAMLVGLTSLNRATLCLAQSSPTIESLFPAVPRESETIRQAIRPAYVDVNTRWVFRAISPVTVHSPIVRLGDIVQPLDPDMAGWQRLQRSAVGLVPLGGEPMTIDRQRLEQVIKAAEATARTIDWIGAEQIQVHYQRETVADRHDEASSPAEFANVHLSQASPQSNIAPASHSAELVTPANMPPADRRETLPVELPPPDPVLIKRLVYWIELAIKRYYPEQSQSHAVFIDSRQTSLHALQSVTGIDHIQILADPISAGMQRAVVTGRSSGGPIRAEIEVTFEPHPIAVVPVESVRRGHRFQLSDLAMRPIPADEWDDRFVVDATELVGMEAKATLRANQPITVGSFGLPILVRRGDRVDVRVLGGGIMVTTGGKALEEGAESALIEVETTEPRKRLLARVVGPGLVEILTRPPRVPE